jgi:hypothetical protein
MATSPHHRCHEINAARAPRRQLPMVQLVFAGVTVPGAPGVDPIYDAARPDATHPVLGPESLRLNDIASPSLIGGGGFGADDSADQAQQQAQLQEQPALQDEQQANDP